jgi:structural maintenance of chromosome 4
LGDLGIIDDKYDVAVTTACGALNNLVVDTVEQGQACIEVLRRGNIGRASIMVLDKLPSRNLSPIETPEGVPRLFDLIQPKETKFAQAFYKGVFNTLVASDLEQAQRIGYGKKRWRVVTLAGQLIDPSGTMSGGGAKVQRGGMSSKPVGDVVDSASLAKYEREVLVAEADMQDVVAERKRREIDLQSIRKRIPEVEIEMEKLQLELKTSDTRIANARERLREVS